MSIADHTDRLEHDLLGEITVPAEVYYGIHTVRALENFPISGRPLSTHPGFVRALAAVKQAAAETNRDLGLLPAGKAEAIVAACTDIRSGKLLEEFVVDVIQGGAGTSSNMNVNEVVANRALELLGHPRGDYEHLHPLQDVNLGQSTNDVYPTAIRVALDGYVQELSAALDHLRAAFAERAETFAGLVKIGRTQLQEAVPMTLGQELGAFASTVEAGRQRLREARTRLWELNLGGTAIGTGLNAHPGYRAGAVEHLRRITGIEGLRSAEDMVAATADATPFVDLSSALKTVAVALSKISNDLRLLSSGPRAGLAEIELPMRQAGSSIMPGKVNPVIPEVVSQVAFEIVGHDVTVSMAAEGGQLQLNAFEPIIAHVLFDGLEHLTAAVTVLADKCVAGITANADRLGEEVAHSFGLVTALSPYIGYDNATAIAREARRTGAGVATLVVAAGLLTQERVDELLSPAALTAYPSS